MPLKFFVNSDGTTDILAKQGESWDILIQITDEDGNPIDLTGYSVKGMMKANYDDSVATAVFNCSIKDPSNGVIEAKLSPSETSNITPYPKSADNVRISSVSEGTQGVYVYDIKVYNDEIAFRVLEGKIVVDPEVSK